MKKLLHLTLILTTLIVVSCKKESGKGQETNPEKIAPDNFNYSTTKEVDVNIRLLSNNDEPLGGVLLTISSADTTKDATTFKFNTDKSGYAKGKITIPAYRDTLIISPNYIGLSNHVKALVSGNVLTAVIGGKEGLIGNIIKESLKLSKAMWNPYSEISIVVDGTNYVYPDGGSDQTSVEQPLGRPKYLEDIKDNISASLLHFINSSIPEGSSVPNTHPEYLNDSAPGSLDITKTSDVYITYVYEGSSYKNTIAYYTYPTNTPPNNKSQIQNVTWVFPNASGNGVGGALNSGDKVKLGQFNAGTSIGFILVQNGWVPNGSTYTVDPSKNKFYSTKKLNPEDNSRKRHNVLLYSPDHKVYVVGFEDLNRQTPSANEYGYTADNDFNDLVVYATTSDATAISPSGLPTVDEGPDPDGDGLTYGDEFPNDPKRAYTVSTSWSTLAFEDRWPETGDYDLNDLVVNYRYHFTANAQNNIVEMTGDYTVVAVGAAFENGFGVQFPFSPDKVSKVTGQKAIKNYIQKSSNGLEAGQTKAVIIPFDNSKALIDDGAGAYIMNTRVGIPKVKGDTAHVYIEFTVPLTQTEIGTSPFNPFLITNMKRGYEIHLPGTAPTDKADKSLFMTEDDRTNIAGNKYYLTVNNWPWAINLAEPFSYPSEGNEISKVYLHFLDWAASGGNLYKDWYSNTSSGYRATTYIYNK